jgi:hypothetical protein
LSLTIMNGRPRRSAIRFQLAGDASAGQRTIGDQRQAFPAEVVDHHQHPEAPAVAQDVRGEVQAPALVRCLRDRQRGPRAERPLAAAALPDRQPLLAVQPEQALVVDHDAFPPQQDQQPPVAEATALGGQLVQPAAELGIVGTTRPVAVGLRCEADQPARPPLRVAFLLDRPPHGLPP